MTSSTLADRALDAARQIIEETGDEAQVTMRGIARRLGVSAPSLYEYFDNVAQIQAHVVEDAMRSFLSAVSHTITSPDRTAESIRLFATEYVTFAREHPQLYRLLFTRHNPSEMPAVGDAARVLFTELVVILANAAGLSGPTPQTQRAAVTMWLELHGIATLPEAHPRFAWPPDDDLISSLVDRTVRLS
jgi:AcrR family transcriptional regulator